MTMNGITKSAAGCGDLKNRIIGAKSSEILIARISGVFLYLSGKLTTHGQLLVFLARPV